jgi:hypothetical protein
MPKDSKLDLQAILKESKAARKRIEKLPAWMQAVIKMVSSAAASEKSRKTLYE